MYIYIFYLEISWDLGKLRSWFLKKTNFHSIQSMFSYFDIHYWVIKFHYIQTVTDRKLLTLDPSKTKLTSLLTI